MRRILLIGDSICMGYSNGPGYHPFVAEALARDGTIVRAQSCAASGTMLQQLDALLAEMAYDIIHFNCGLHDLKRDRSTLQVQTPLDDYALNLARIVERLDTTGATLIWATITPVDDELHQSYKPFDRRQADVIAYNARAIDVMGRGGVQVNDLHEAVVRAGMIKLLHTDGVHFTEAASRLLAQAVVGAVSRFP